MAARVARHMSLARASILVFVVVALLTTLFMIKISQGEAIPGSPTDSTKVPHYFGPWPNWALSPLTLPDVKVDIPGGTTPATATASIGADGSVTGITVTSPGAGYTGTTVPVNITPASATGTGTGATATATVQASGGVSAVTIANGGGGGGYVKPVVTFTGGGFTTAATATPYGHLDTLTLTGQGTGYTAPTVDFDMPDDPNGVQAVGHVTWDAQTGVIQTIVIDNPGSGYASAPNVVIRDGTLMDPINNGGTGATATSTIAIDTVGLDSFGAGYTSAPTVSIDETTAATVTAAQATATIDGGIISGITVVTPGSNYITSGGIRKFQDALPALCDPATAGSCPDYTQNPNAKYIPLGVPANKVYNGVRADEYDIAVIQYKTNFSSSLPDTLVRGYVQLETPDNAAISQHFPLVQYNKDGSTTPLLDANQNPILAVTPPQWLGPTIVATKNRPVRIRFHNLLPTGAEGDLFLPTDSTLMGSGMGPMAMADPTDAGTVMDLVRNPVCSEYPKGPGCFKDNRATLHLHGGTTPWISDGTPHQWITPAGENTTWPQGVSVKDVPDMTPKDIPDDGIQTFYYTNQQGARLMFYHDHAWGITRLNVYAGEAAGYLITDDTEKKLVGSGTIPSDQIPLVIQDRTFVPQNTQMFDQTDANGKITSYGQDPTWDAQRWGGYGSLWYHHVYMPAQNPGDPSGMSAYGRWMYGPWFWPPAAATVYGPIDNPYYAVDANGNPTCDVNNPATWTYQTDPFCEPKQIPGTPNISVGMEQFNDTPIVNGVAYPTITLQPKTYRLRMLNAANDRFFNFQWYVADPNTASTALNKAGQAIGGTEVALDPAQLAAAQTDPAGVYPTPVNSVIDPVTKLPINTAGPDWIQIGTEGGFLPAPAVIKGQQPITWITDPTRFDFGNVDQHSLVLAPAERADVVVDFSKYAGQTLILYNDAPAAYPARVPSYDYYTGGPDLSPNGAPAVLPGFGPNTRTVMQVKIAPAAPAAAFNLRTLRNAFSHKADGSGVFESGQHPIIVGQNAYNSAYGTNFPANGNCSPVSGSSTLQLCDGFVRVNDTAKFDFNTLKSQKSRVEMPLQPKAIHDEMNSTTFDEYGRMQANLGVEAQPPTPGLQNVTLYPYVNPATELINGTNLPTPTFTYDAGGNVVNDFKITPMSSTTDGTQIWRVTHNGVDTHPIHFHLYDVQVINRVTWDNIIIPPDANELGWKDTVRISPLEDTIVALRPIVPSVPFEVPNSVRNLNPMMPTGSTAGFNPIDPQGNGAAITNQLVNYGWEYVWHCHILSHEEMDMMRPESLVLPPKVADGLSFTYLNGQASVTFTDNSIAETSYDLQRDDGAGFNTVGTSDSPLDQVNGSGGSRTIVDPTYDPNVASSYQVVANNTAGYGSGFPTMTASSTSATVATGPAPAAPSNLTWALASIDLSWTDNATTETGYTVQRSADGGTTFVTIASLPANATSYSDKTPAPGTSYIYRVRADQNGVSSAWVTTPSIAYPAVPAAPTGLTVMLQAGPQGYLQWTDNASNETAYVVERSPHGQNTWTTVATLAANTSNWTDTTVLPGDDWDYRVAASHNIVGLSGYSNIARLQVPTVPTPPTTVVAGVTATANGPQVDVTWTNTATNADAVQLQRSVDGATFADVSLLPGTAASYTDTTVATGHDYQYQVRAVNMAGSSAYAQSNTVTVPLVPAAPANLTSQLHAGPSVTLGWSATSTNTQGFGYRLQRSSGTGGTWTTLTAPAAADVSATDTGISTGTTYTYRIQAYNVSGASTWATWSAIAVPIPPAAPSNLTRTITRTTAGPDSVVLTWADNASSEDGFTLQRATNSAFTAGLQTFTLGANVTSYSDSVAHGNTYYYRVQAFNVIAISAWSNVVNATTVPATPTNLSASNLARTRVTVNWADNSTNETGYRVQYKRANSTQWNTATTTAANATSYRVVNLSPNTSYDFRVRGVNGVGNSPWSASVRARTLP